MQNNTGFAIMEFPSGLTGCVDFLCLLFLIDIIIISEIRPLFKIFKEDINLKKSLWVLLYDREIMIRKELQISA